MNNEKIQIILEAVQKGRDEFDKTIKQIKELSKESEKQGGVVEKLRAGFSNLSKVALVLAGAIGTVLSAFLLFNRHTLERIDSLAKEARSLETSVERLQALKYAAQMAGVENQEMTMGLRNLQKAISEAHDPSSQAAKDFRELGVSFQGSNGEGRNVIDVFEDITESYKNHNGAAEKVRLSQDLLAARSKNMVDFLNHGKEAISESAAELKKFGGTISTETAENVEKFNDNIARMKTLLEAFSANLLAKLLPQMIDFSERAVEWANKTRAMADESGYLTGTIRTLGQAWTLAAAGARFLGVIIGSALGLAFHIITAEVRQAIDLFDIFIKSLKDIALGVVDIVKKFAEFGTVFSRAVHGDFAGAATAAKDAIAGILGEEAKLFGGIGDNAQRAAKVVALTTKEIGSDIFDTANQAWQDTKKIADEAQQMWANSNGPTNLSINKFGTMQGPPLPPGRNSNPNLSQDPKFLDALQDKWKEFMKNLTSTTRIAGELIEGTIGRAISGVSDGISGVVWGTKSWGQAMAETGKAIVDTIIRIGVEWVAGAILRKAISAGETVFHAGQTATQVGVHAAGEGAKTGSTAFGALSRGAIRVGETIWHGIQTAAKVAAHIGAEILMTTVTLIQSGIRIVTILIEAGKYLIVAAIKAMSAVADIPVVGPFLAIAALAAVLAVGAKAMGAFEEGGYTGDGGRSQVAGTVHRGEVVIPQPIVQQHGLAHFASYFGGRMPGYAGGGLVTTPSFQSMTGGGRSSGGGNITLVDARNRQDERDIAAKDAYAIVIDKARRRGNRLNG